MPKGLEGQYVFVSPQRDALIIRVPPDSEYARSGKSTVIRYDLHNRVEPSLAVNMERGGAGAFRFDYTVTNRSAASDQVGMWWLIVPATGEKPMASSIKWGGVTSDLAIERQVELPDQPVGRATGWFKHQDAEAISPGQSRSGFHVESSCRPGFTTALFGSGIWVNIDQDLPNEVFKQLDFYNDPTWGKIPILTLGPIFCAGFSRQAMAQNMISGIKRLIETKRLDPKSGFVRDSLAQINSQLAENPGETATIAHSPSGALETEIGKALELSLSFKIVAP